MPLSEHGSVLGIDVGYSARRKTTGFCALSWDARTVRWRCENAGVDERNRHDTLRRVLPEAQRQLLAVAIDGPLRPGLHTTPRYRCAESLLSRGAFSKRGKPGPTNGGSGRDLHAHATRLAHFVLQECGVEAAAHVPAIHARAIVEAFPNLFLGVLCDEADYPAEPHRQRKWTDTRSEEHTSELQSLAYLVCRLLLEKKKDNDNDVYVMHSDCTGATE